jgi:hypothetical protein
MLLAALTIVLCSCPAPARPSSLTNSGFEIVDPVNGSLAASWTAYGSGYALDRAVKHSGALSVRCESAGVDKTYGAMTTVTLDQTTAAPIVVSGWSRAQNVGGAPNSDYSVYVDLTYADGTPLWAQTASFDTGSHDWQFRHILIVPAKPVRSMNIYALFRNHSGTVWFDDFDAHELSPSLLFDSQAISPPVLASGAFSGWFVRDVAAGSALQPLRLNQASLGIVMTSEKIESIGAVVEVAVKNTTAAERAITIYYVERFEAREPVWWNDIRSKSPAGGGEYANLTPVNVGATGQLSVYPFGCATGAGMGRALGVPAWEGPRVERIELDSRANLLYVAFDVALTAAGDASTHDRAQVAITRYDVDPDWGFRDAAAKYYALFPSAFARRASAGGIWMPFESPEDVQGLADFHVAYHEGDNSVAGDRANGVLSFRYVEPMTYWMSMPKTMPRDYSHAIDLVREQAASDDEASASASRQAQAVLYSGSSDTHGNFNVSFENTPWCDGAVWILNPNPAMPHPSGSWTKALLNEAGEPSSEMSNQPDGEYLDSLEANADVLDYRAESLACTTLPLTFATDDYRPTVPTWFSVYEAASNLSQDLHKHGKLLMANTTPWRFSVFDPLLDVLGTEMNCFSDTGAWSPEPDSIMNLRRTIAYHKPYLELLDTDFSKVSEAGIEQYFQRCLFYGIFPSMFSADAADSPYWQNTALYNRDRPLFKLYIPVIQRLSAAGWEPVTWAHSDNPAVWIERYGEEGYTVLNSTDSPQDCVLTIDCRRLFPGRQLGSDKWKALDLLSNSALEMHWDAGQISFHLRLKPSETRVVAISDRV